MRQKYIDKLVAMLPEAGFEAMLISPSDELKFFTGISPMLCERFQGLFVKSDGAYFYICNLLYGDEIRALLRNEVPVYTWFDGDGMVEPVVEILREQGLIGKKIGVNSSAQAFNVLELMEKADIVFRNGKPLLEEVRIHKSHDELEKLRRAAEIADAAFQPVLKFIKPGITEGDIRDFLFEQMISRGGNTPFAIVASGSNSGFPHSSSYDRAIQKGDGIILDWGCDYEGMQSDNSRTVFVGEVSEEQRDIYELVKRAQRAAEEMAVEGAWIPDIDRTAREILDEKGLAYTLINRVGHGVGYSIHEGPDIKQSNKRRLERGMVFSIEPGVYLGNIYGVRIENLVAINENGETEVLNKTPRELTIIPVE